MSELTGRTAPRECVQTSVRWHEHWKRRNAEPKVLRRKVDTDMEITIKGARHIWNSLARQYDVINRVRTVFYGNIGVSSNQQSCRPLYLR